MPPFVTAIIVIIAFLFFGVLVWYVSTRNAIKKAELKVAEAESGIDVALTKRYDMLTKAVSAAKTYAGHEKDLLITVAVLRNGAPLAEKLEQSKRLDELAGRITAVAEAYPELKANSVFVALQAQIADAEEHLQAARRLYNSNVSRYNEKLVTFPSSVVAGRMALEPKEYFSADPAKTDDVSIK